MGQLAEFFKEQNIALAQQQRAKMLSLHTKFEEAKAERDSLKTENLALRAQVKPLEEKVKRLEDRLKEYSSPKDKNVVHDKLDELEEAIISYLARVRREHRTTAYVARAMREVGVDPDMTELRAKVTLERMAQRDYVGLVINMEGPSYWKLMTRGEQYAVLHGLDK